SNLAFSAGNFPVNSGWSSDLCSSSSLNFTNPSQGWRSLPISSWSYNISSNLLVEASFSNTTHAGTPWTNGGIWFYWSPGRYAHCWSWSGCSYSASGGSPAYGGNTPNLALDIYTAPACTTPGTVSGLGSSSVTGTGAHLSWNTPSGSPTLSYYYEVHRASDNATVISLTNTSNLYANVSGLSNCTQYYFRVFAYTTCDGSQSAVWSSNSYFTTINCCSAPSNESCSGTSIGGLPYSYSGSLGCTDDCSGRPYNDVFFRYIFNYSGSYTADMCGSEVVTYMRVYSGSCCGSLVGSDDDACGGGAPTYTFSMNSGTTYYFECGSYGSGDPGNQSYSFNLAMNCNNASVPNGLWSSVTGQTSASLYWNASSSGTPTIYYYWEVQTSGGSYVDDGYAGSGTSANVNGLSCGTQYRFKVQAYNCSTYSSWSSYSYFTTSSCCVVAGTPSTPSPSSSTICQGSANTSYTTFASDADNYTWTVSGGNSISGTGTTGTVTWAPGYSGTATVSVRANGCAGNSSTVSTNVFVTPTVGTPSTPTPSVTSICQGSANTSYTTSATNATSYNWTVTAPNSISGTGATGTVTWDPSYSGLATVSVTATGCGTSSAASTTVMVNPTPTLTITDPAAVCAPATVNLTAATVTAGSTVGLALTYWTDALATISYPTPATATAATYYIKGTVPGTGCYDIKPVIATVNPLPDAAGIINGTSPVCQTQTGVSYSLGAINNATTYTWAYTGAGATISGSTNPMTIDFAPTATSGDLTVKGNNSCGDGSTSPAYHITVNTVPNIPGAITGPTTVCQGHSGDAYSVAGVTGATGYIWTLPSGATIASGTNTNSITVNYSTGAFSGNITVAGTNDCGTGPVSANYAITVDPLPDAAGTITGPLSVCPGQSGLSYSVPAVANALSYTWAYSGAGATINGSTNPVTIDFTTTVTPGNLTVYCTNACGNGVVSPPYAVLLDSPAGPAGAISGQTTVCQGENGVSYNVPAIAFATGYIWTLPGGATIATGANTNTITVNYSTTAVLGDITVQGFNACDSGTISANYPITVNPLPDAAGIITGIVAGSDTVCVSESGVSYTVPAITGALSYTWTYSGTGETISGTTNPVSIDFSASATSGNLTVSGTNGCGNGIASANYPISVTPLPDPAGTITGSDTVCQGLSNVSYSVPNINSATSYTWAYSGAGATILGSTDSVTINFTVTATPGNLTVFGVNVCGVGTVSANYPIAIDSLPDAAGTITGNDTVCQGQTTVSYHIPPIAYATGYSWSLPTGATITYGANTDSITVDLSNGALSGDIAVYGTNACGNGVTSANFPVTVNLLPDTAGIISGVDTVCVSQTGVLYSVPPIDSAKTYTWAYTGTGATISGTTNAVTIDFSASATSGNLTVKGTNPCGDGIASANYAISVTPLPDPAGLITSVNDTVCQGQNGASYSVTNINSATSYTWAYSGAGATISGSTNPVTINFSVTASPGNLTVTGVNVCGAGTVSADYPIGIDSLPVAAGTIIGSDTVCQGQTTVSYHIPPIAYATGYSWSLPVGASITYGANTDSITIDLSTTALSGDIVVHGTNACGNGVASANYPVTVNPLPVAAGAITGPLKVCQGQTGVLYWVPVITNATGYNWTLPTGATIVMGANTDSITVDFSKSALTGNFAVYGTNDCGNGIVSPNFLVSVDILPYDAGTITGPDTVCQGQNIASYSVLPITGALSYEWAYSGTGATISGSTNPVNISFSTTATQGILTIFGRNACGDGVVSADFPIFMKPLPDAAGTISGNDTVCQGQTSVSYTVPAITEATGYSWSLPFGASIVWGANTDSITVDYSVTALSGNITVAGTNDCGNGIISANYAITVDPLPVAAGVITGDDTVCVSEAGVSYSVPSIANAAGYIWEYSGTGATISDSTSSMTIDFSASATSGNLTVKGINDCGNGVISANYAIVVIPLPDPAGVITGSDTVCQGQNTVSYSVPNIFSATSYTWSYSGAGATISGTTNPVSIDFSVNASPGNLTVIGVNDCGVGVISADYPILIDSLPVAAGLISGSDTVCQGQNGVSYTVPAIPYATGYVWSLPTGATIASGTNTNSIIVDYSTIALSGNIKVYGTNFCGNGIISADYPVKINLLPDAAGDISGQYLVCKGQADVPYTVPPIDSALTYTWSYSGTGATISDSSNSVTIDFSASATSGNLTVTGTNACGNGIVSSDFAIILMTVPDLAGAITGTTPVCQGQNGVSYSLTDVPGAVSYTWLYSGTGAEIIGSTNPVIINFATDATSGNLTVMGTNACGNGTVSADFPIALDPLPESAGAITGTDILCQGQDNLTYTIPAIANASGYIWTLPDGATITSGANTNSITIDYSDIAISGNITVLGINNCGNGDTSEYAITVNPYPVVYAGNDTIKCEGDYITLSATGGQLYVWNTGDSTQSITIIPSGTSIYSVTVTDDKGCFASDEVLVTIKPLPLISLLSDPADNSIYLGQEFTVNAEPSTYSIYNFYIDSTLVQTGQGFSYFSTSLTDGQIIYVTAIENGCEGPKDSLLINVKPISNAFTPIHNDGVNDLFLKGLNIKIFNRWGQMIYEGKDGWDGKYNGQYVSKGTYYYVIKLTNVNGSDSNVNGVNTEVKGTVNIVN
ncbi:MAG: hypothetical protein HGB12_03335, partial [Bacteroidetes bacterium]|nr:hypothetical protein [Bacteroidota bacterium]